MLDCECLLHYPAAAKFKSMDGGQWRARYQKKQNKSNDQRAPVNRYYLIKDPRSLDIKYYLVTGGLSSIARLYNNGKYMG